VLFSGGCHPGSRTRYGPYVQDRNCFTREQDCRSVDNTTQHNTTHGQNRTPQILFDLGPCGSHSLVGLVASLQLRMDAGRKIVEGRLLFLFVAIQCLCYITYMLPREKKHILSIPRPNISRSWVNVVTSREQVG
jgi:hypothetical protein